MSVGVKDSAMVNIAGMGKNIYKARTELGWSRQTAAAYIGISEQSLCRWESGSTKSIKEASYNRLLNIMDGTAKLEDDYA